jgi:hypothetical protein
MLAVLDPGRRYPPPEILFQKIKNSPVRFFTFFKNFQLHFNLGDIRQMKKSEIFRGLTNKFWGRARRES